MSFLFREMKKGGRRLAATLIAALIGPGAAVPAIAGSFQVNPVNIELPAGRSSTSVTLRNNSRDPVSIRVVAMKWTQENGADVYTPGKELIVSPPIFTIKGGATQLVRLGLRGENVGSAYRVIFEEIPSRKPEGSGIQVALRLNLPLYVLEEKGEPRVSWKALRSADGELVLEARNDGTRHAQFVEISTVDARGNKVMLSRQMGVVLPGSSRQWKTGRKDIVLSSTLPIIVRRPGSEIKTDAVVEAR